VILDHIERLELPDVEAELHFDSRMALARLGEGLFWLYDEVQRIEVRTRQEAAKDNVTLVVSGGVLEGKPLGVLSCAFMWYAVSACNYAQLVGWLATRETQAAKDYVRRVMPQLLNYRHKVAAHLALTEPRQDNEADLAASVMTQVVYAHGRLCTAALSPVVTSKGQEITASRDLSWSLTLAHERLLRRYWPDGPPTSSQALRVPPGRVTLNVRWSDLLGDEAAG
jgi:hypothetical protein